MTERAQKIIQNEIEKKTGILNLNNCGLTEIPPEIYEMDWVQVLNLSNDRYWDINEQVFRNMPAEVFGDKRNGFRIKNEIIVPPNLDVISFGDSILEISKTGNLILDNVTALDLANNRLDNLSFIKGEKNLKQLDLFNNNFLHLGSIIEMIEGLKYLNLRHNKISIIDEVNGPNNLETLMLGNNYINRINDVSQFFKLINLDLAVNSISKIEGLESMYLLKDLSLAQNKITKIENLWSNTELRSLHLGYNPISKIENLSHLAKLQKLKLKNAKISTIEGLDELKYLNHLDLSSNEITFIDELYSNHNLNELYLHDNPISPNYGLVFKQLENHWPTLRNYFERQNEKHKIDINLPVKVLLLGNHESGKSTLLHYLKTGKLDKIQKSTHILNIDFYNIERRKNDNFYLPDAIFYDFGGQDYYHGLYKTFLSKDSLYILLWKNSTNENYCVGDTNGLTCTHFNLQYWFGQKKFLETEKWEQSGSPNPTYLIQTHSDIDGVKKSGIHIEENNVVDEISLSFQHDKNEDLLTHQNKAKHLKLQAFKEDMDNKLTQLKVLKQEPQWYVDFLSFVFNAPHSYVPYTLDEIFPHYRRLMDSDQEKIDFFIDDLQQLHYRGIILYYKDINPNIVWMSPGQFAEYVQTNLFAKDIILNNFGKIDKSDFEQNLNKNSENYIIEILKEQKVIFFDKITQYYIVPGFLQMSSEDNYYKGLSTGKSSLQYVMKFEKYLPFGFMNQLICFYGNLPDEKWYWRDELIFFINETKIQIKLDFCNLEVVVNFIDAQGKKDLNKIRRYLFYSIISLYWDHDTLDFTQYSDYLDNKIEKGELDIDDPLCNQLINYDNLYTNSYCRPNDLMVSLDGIHFINYHNFWEDCKKATVTCWVRDKDGNLSTQTTTETEPYKHLFKNKYYDFKLEKVFKMAISYAKEDHSTLIYGYNPIQELYDNLNILKNDYNLDIFIDRNIDENNWDRQIREKFNEADLIIVMNSTNYNKTDKKYIWEVEMPIINKKYEDRALSILRINILDSTTSKAVNKFNDFKKGTIPSEIRQRAKFLKNLIKEIIQPQI